MNPFNSAESERYEQNIGNNPSASAGITCDICYLDLESKTSTTLYRQQGYSYLRRGLQILKMSRALRRITVWKMAASDGNQSGKYTLVGLAFDARYFNYFAADVDPVKFNVQQAGNEYEFIAQT